jgi:hypothetical protein
MEMAIIHMALSKINYMLRLYCPPTLNSASVICPKLAISTVFHQLIKAAVQKDFFGQELIDQEYNSVFLLIMESQTRMWMVRK